MAVYIPEIHCSIKNFQYPLPEDKLFPGNALAGDHQYICSWVTRGVKRRHPNCLCVVLDQLVPQIEISLPQAAIKKLSSAFHLNSYLHRDYLAWCNCMYLNIHAVSNSRVVCDSVWDTCEAYACIANRNNAGIHVNLQSHLPS